MVVKPKKKMGRKKIEIDWKIFDGLCEIQCTLVEIASVLKVSEDTIERRIKENFNKTFAEHFKIQSAGGKTSLRRAQFNAALNGNTALLIWLGKQYLGQSDRQDVAIGEFNPDDKFL